MYLAHRRHSKGKVISSTKHMPKTLGFPFHYYFSKHLYDLLVPMLYLRTQWQKAMIPAFKELTVLRVRQTRNDNRAKLRVTRAQLSVVKAFQQGAVGGGGNPRAQISKRTGSGSSTGTPLDMLGGTILFHLLLAPHIAECLAPLVPS